MGQATDVVRMSGPFVPWRDPHSAGNCFEWRFHRVTQGDQWAEFCYEVYEGMPPIVDMGRMVSTCWWEDVSELVCGQISSFVLGFATQYTDPLSSVYLVAGVVAQVGVGRQIVGVHCYGLINGPRGMIPVLFFLGRLDDDESESGVLFITTDRAAIAAAGFKFE